MDILSKLNKALKGGSPATPQPTAAGLKLIHENEAAILDAARQLLSKSEVGGALLDFAQSSGIQIHVLKNKQDFGIFPNESTVYISCPAGQPMPPARAALHLVGALREAMQDREPDFARPDLSVGSDSYANQMAERKRNQLFWQCAVAYELAEVNGLLEIIDEIRGMGYLEAYEAYKVDLQNQASG